MFGDGESSFLLLRSLVWRNGDEAGKKAGPGIKAGLRWNVEGQGSGFRVRATACHGKCPRVLDVMPERVSHVANATTWPLSCSSRSGWHRGSVRVRGHSALAEAAVLMNPSVPVYSGTGMQVRSEVDGETCAGKGVGKAWTFSGFGGCKLSAWSW